MTVEFFWVGGYAVITPTVDVDRRGRATIPGAVTQRATLQRRKSILSEARFSTV